MDTATLVWYLRKKRRALATRSSRILALNPLGYWTLHGGPGATAADSSGNGLDGAITGAAWGVQTGTDGTPALHFDGVNDLVLMDETAILQPDSALSLSLWARAEAGTGCVLSMDEGSCAYA